MKNLIDDIKKHTPDYIADYNYIKTQKIYIPFKKIIIECLTRKISELNLFFESILKLINISVNNIDEIAEILGVTIGVINEAIIDMVHIDYIFASDGILTMTAKGKKALETRKKIEIKKSYLKDLVVDMITGIVYDAEFVKLSKSSNRSVTLEEVIKIDNSYLETHFQEINNIYITQQRDNSFFGDNSIENELDKIIRVSYSELCYLETQIYIYKSDFSEELMFVFRDDNKDMYKNECYNQLKEAYKPCQEYFFEQNKDFINEIKNHKLEIEIRKKTNSQNLTKFLYLDQIDEDDLFKAFVSDRYALNDTEYLSYFYHLKAFPYSRVYICSNYLGHFLSRELCNQISILAESIPIFIVYNKNEYKIQETIKYFFKDCKKYLYLFPREYIDDNIICFDSELIFYFKNRIVTAFDRPISYLQIECSFSKQVVSEEINRINIKYDLSIPKKENHKLNKSKKLKSRILKK